MPSYSRNLALYSRLILFGLAPLIAGHGNDEPEMDMDMTMTSTTMAMATAIASITTNSSAMVEPPNYFRYPEHGGAMVAHIIFMTVAWVFFLPLCEWLGSDGKCPRGLIHFRCDVLYFSISFNSSYPIRLPSFKRRRTFLRYNLQCLYSGPISEQCTSQIGMASDMHNGNTAGNWGYQCLRWS